MAPLFSRQEVARLDPEHGTDYDMSSGEETQRRSFWKPRYVIAAVLGSAVLAGCAVGMKSSSSAPPAQPKKLTARMLFESDLIHEAAAENVLNAHSKMPDATKSKEEVREIVTKTFKNIIDTMEKVDPKTWHALESTEMTHEQHEGVAHILKALKDPSVMKLGVDTAKALREATSDGKEAQAKSVYDTLMPRKAELLELYDKTVPKHMQEILKYKPGDGFKRMLEPHNAKVLKSVGGTYYDQFTAPEKSMTSTERRLQYPHEPEQDYPHEPVLPPPTPIRTSPQIVPNTPPAYTPQGANPYTHFKQAAQPAVPQGHSYQYSGVNQGMTKALEGLGIIGTVAGEADSIVRIINPICKEFDDDLKINPAITTGIGAADFVFQVADCELDAVADHFNPVEALGCPAMASSAGFDAMREGFTAAGILGDNNAANGEQGNHEGERKVHEGILDDSSGGKEMEKEWPLCAVFAKGGCSGSRKYNDKKKKKKNEEEEEDGDYEEEDDE